MIKYLIDDSYEGLLSAVYYSLKNNESVGEIKNFATQLSMLDVVKKIPLDYENAQKVDTKIKKIASLNSCKELKLAMRSGEKDKLTIIFNYVMHLIKNGKDLSKDFLNEWVLKFSELVYKIKYEIHRYTGFIRFQKTSEGIYYAHFSPDNNVCDLLLPHFIKRYNKMPIILHDINYNVICAYNGKESKIVNKKLPPLKVDDSVINLFKLYYQSVNIKSRRNVKLQRNYMPKRYARFMPETHDFDLV